MADNGNGEEDARLDIESMEDKNAQIKEIEKLAFDPDQYEDIQRDFAEFINSIVDMNNLKKFKQEYQGIYKALAASHKLEKQYIDECRIAISKIWDTAQQVKQGIRAAATEVDKIEDLKHRVEEEQTKVQTLKEASEDK